MQGASADLRCLLVLEALEDMLRPRMGIESTRSLQTQDMRHDLGGFKAINTFKGPGRRQAARERTGTHRSGNLPHLPILCHVRACGIQEMGFKRHFQAIK